MTSGKQPDVGPRHVVALGILAMIATAAGYMLAAESFDTFAGWLHSLT